MLSVNVTKLLNLQLQSERPNPDVAWARDPGIPVEFRHMLDKSLPPYARCDRAVAHPMRPAFVSRPLGTGTNPISPIKTVAIFNGFPVKDEPNLALVGEDGLALMGEGGELVETMSLADTVVGPAAISPDGLMLAVGIAAKDTNTWRAVSIFEVNSGTQIHRREHPPTELSLSWSPESRFLAIGASGGFGIAGGLEIVDVPARRSLVPKCDYSNNLSLSWSHDASGDLHINVGEK